MMRVVELFAGIGAQRMSLMLEGIPHEVVAISEIDRPALKSYLTIYGDCPNLGDIRDVGRLPDCDVVTASFPCQSLSITGRREGMTEGSGTESALGWEVVRLIGTSVAEGRAPEYIVWENVPTLLTNPEFPRLVDRLSGMGYHSRWAKLDSSDFGSAQRRVRAFMLSRYMADPPDLPTSDPDAPRPCLKDVMDPERDDKYVMRIPLEDVAWRRDARPREGISVLADWRRKGRLDLANRIYDENGLSPAMVCHGGGNREVKTTARETEDGCLIVNEITPRESWRLMGFPEWAFDRASEVTSETQLYNQAGNSISVEVLRKIFRTIVDAQSKRRTRQTRIGEYA